MKQEMLRKSIITAAMTASLGLTACGGGGGDTPPPPNVNPPPASVTLSGKVADGYIIGATVCLDLNNNKVCDPGEPSTVTSTGGTYAFDATQVDIDTYPIVVEVPGDGSAYDEDDNGAPIANNYVLTAPAGQGTTEVMVTPLTTMVQNEIENNPTLTAAEAETAVLSSMGVTDSTVSLFDDYVAESDATTNTTNAAEYERLHMIAQATAVTIAENMDDIQAVADTDPTLTLTVDYLIAMIVDEVVEALSTMTATVDAAITVGDDSSSFDETTATVTTAITDTTILEAEIAEEELKQSTTTVASIETLFEAGIHYIEAEFSQYDAWIDYGVWKAISGNMNDTYYNYDFTINDWVLNTSNDIESFILQTDGTWLATLESVWNSPSVTFD